MQRFLTLLLLLSTTGFLRGNLSPLTVKDVSLLLRAGEKPAVVEHELATRHLAAPLSPEDESILLKAGAMEALVDAMKTGQYTVPPEEAAAVEAQLAAQKARRAAQAAESHKRDTLYQSQIVKSRAVTPVPTPAIHPIAALLKGDLVCWKNGSLSAVDSEALSKKKLIALFFSSNSSKPGRLFTPRLIEFYNRVAPQHPEFDIIFVSCDRSQFAMETYVGSTQMPWPVLDPARLESKPQLRQLGGDTLPCLFLVDTSGRMLADSYDGKNYVGPEKALADIEAIFAKGAPVAVVQGK